MNFSFVYMCFLASCPFNITESKHKVNNFFNIFFDTLR